jgi:hypothetical protein
MSGTIRRLHRFSLTDPQITQISFWVYLQITWCGRATTTTRLETAKRRQNTRHFERLAKMAA